METTIDSILEELKENTSTSSSSSSSSSSTECKSTSAPTSKSTSTPRYCVLMETSEEHSESWYYFLKYDGNENALNHLQKQLESIKNINDRYDDVNVFDLELDNLVSEQTAKEMSRLDLNSFTSHRKFDGTLKKIDFRFKPKNSDEQKINKIFEMIGLGKIEDFIDKEDLDPDDVIERFSSDEGSDEDGEDDEGGDTDDEDEDSEEENKETKETRNKMNRVSIDDKLRKYKNKMKVNRK